MYAYQFMSNSYMYLFYLPPGGESIRWQFIHGLFESAIYGGRVDNLFDVRVLQSYLQQLFNQDLLGGRSRSNGTMPAGTDLPASTTTSVSKNRYKKTVQQYMRK